MNLVRPEKVLWAARDTWPTLAARGWWWWVAILASLAALRAAVVALQSEQLVEGTDAFWYELLGWNLLQGRGLSLELKAPFGPTMYREPGYPSFVAALYSLVGREPRAIALVQAGLLGATVVVAALLGRRALGHGAGLTGALLVTLSPDQTDVARQVLSETVFTLLLYVAALAALRARDSGRPSGYLLVGLLFGALTLVRVQGQTILLLLLPLWFILDRVQFKQWRIGRLLLLASAAACVMAPWLVRNALTFQRPSLTQRYGAALLPRGVRATYPPEQHLAWAGQAAWMATTPLSAVFIPLDRFQYGERYYENDIWDFHLSLSTKAVAWGAESCQAMETAGPGALEERLSMLPFDPRRPLDQNLWRAKFEDCGLGIALRLIREHPLAYLAQMPFEWVKLNFYPLPSRLALFRNTLAWAAFATVAWLTYKRRLRKDALWLVALAAAYNAQAMVADPAERYAVPLLPLYYLFAAAGIMRLTYWVAALKERKTGR